MHLVADGHRPVVFSSLSFDENNKVTDQASGYALFVRVLDRSNYCRQALKRSKGLLLAPALILVLAVCMGLFSRSRESTAS